MRPVNKCSRATGPRRCLRNSAAPLLHVAVTVSHGVTLVAADRLETMTNDSLQPVANDQLRISVEVGDDYQASERVSNALAELTQALLDENSDDVQGFQSAEIIKLRPFQHRSYVFDSHEPDSFCSTTGNKQEPYLKLRDH